jgi:hypothetical protein
MNLYWVADEVYEFYYITAKNAWEFKKNSTAPWFRIWYLNGHTEGMSLTGRQKSNPAAYNENCKLM